MSSQTLADPLKELSKAFPELTHTFNFLLGAIISLQEARSLDHKNRAEYGASDQRQHLVRFLQAVDDFESGGKPTSIWMAGFYYNSAIMRIDACHERFLKAMLKAAGVKIDSIQIGPGETKTDAYARELERSLTLPPFTRQHLASTRQEVNRLKHRLFGQESQHAKDRQEDDIANAEASIIELLAMIEHSAIQPLLAATFPGDPIP